MKFYMPARLSKRQQLSEYGTILGELGCSEGGYARAAALTKRELTCIARQAANIRWSRVK